MNENKPFKSFEEQIKLLKSKKLKIEKESHLIWYLKKYNYQRIINGYNDPFFKGQNRKNDLYRDNVNSQMIIDFFNLDRSIANILNGTIHSVELTLNTAICYELLKILKEEDKQNFNYVNNSFLKEKIFNIEDDRKLENFLKGIIDIKLNNEKLFPNCSDSRFDNYEYKKQFPLYKLCLKWDFGVTIKVFENLKEEIQRLIVNTYFKKFKLLDLKSFIYIFHCVRELRNKISHNEVIYNADFSNLLRRFYRANKALISSDVSSLIKRKKKTFKLLLFDLVVLICMLDDFSKDKTLFLITDKVECFFKKIDCDSKMYISNKLGFKLKAVKK